MSLSLFFFLIIFLWLILCATTTTSPPSPSNDSLHRAESFLPSQDHTNHHKPLHRRRQHLQTQIHDPFNATPPEQHTHINDALEFTPESSHKVKKGRKSQMKRRHELTKENKLIEEKIREKEKELLRVEESLKEEKEEQLKHLTELKRLEEELNSKITAKYYYLYNRCSGGRLNLVGKKASANPRSGHHSPSHFPSHLRQTESASFSFSGDLLDNDYAVMSLQSHMFGTSGPQKIGVTIQGKKSGVFLCFNKRGKLVNRFLAATSSCFFRETRSDNNYIRFESLLNPQWIVGFNSRGKPLHHIVRDHPVTSTRKAKCFQFIKVPIQVIMIDTETQVNDEYDTREDAREQWTPSPDIMDEISSQISIHNQDSRPKDELDADEDDSLT